MKRIIFVIVSGFVLSSLCFTQVRTGEIERGIFLQEGIASWYGADFNGKPTASGEIFNDSLFTAAHPILPFGTMLKVTSRHNNKTVTVRVNDRGPFVAARIIDLSRAAAQQLDMISTGTAPVIVESLHEVSLPARPFQNTPVAAASPVAAYPAPVQAAAPVQPISAPETYSYTGVPGDAVQVKPASVEPSPSGGISGQAQNWNQGQPQVVQPWEQTLGVRFQPSIPLLPTGKQYRVQVGAYREPQYAIETFEKLKNAGLNPAYERYGEYYRVVLGGLKQEELKSVSDRLGLAGFKEVLLREEK
ncbi:MAG: septal ring lytic transglycosylase RlpA family protein [Treponema sp.]|nr:septal ring lytic transglycosylase RlpA family protein [Treponema sp.]